ncbi:Toll/interleukin-1 receptor domain-containing protein [Tanacetum coccineum]
MVNLTEISEASSSTHDRIYDVFISFRGDDTRNNFTNHLFHALVYADINTFLDDKEIKVGNDLKPELETAIRSSRASVIILSKNYASSTQCLNELVLILDQHRKFNQIVIPIFYHVEPKDVSKQQGSFGDAMADHKQRMEAETNEEVKSQLAHTIEIWKNALTEVASLEGIDVNGRSGSRPVLVPKCVPVDYFGLKEKVGSQIVVEGEAYGLGLRWAFKILERCLDDVVFLFSKVEVIGESEEEKHRKVYLKCVTAVPFGVPSSGVSTISTLLIPANACGSLFQAVPLLSVVTSRQGSRSLARLRDEMRQASDTQEYPSLIDTFWRTHTVDGVFPKDKDRRIYEEMKRLEATGEYTEDEINALASGGKLHGHIPGVGRVLPSRATSRPSMPAPDKSLKSMHKKVEFMMSLFRSDSKYSDMFKECESGGASGSGGCGDDEESGDDEDGDGDD